MDVKESQEVSKCVEKDIGVDSLTVHGFNRIYKGNKKQRLFWGIVFFICLGVFIRCAVDLCVKFMQFQSNNEIKIIRPGRMQFPSITFCNQARMQFNFGKRDVNSTVDDITTALSDGFYNFSVNNNFCSFDKNVRCGIDDFYAIGRNSNCVTLNSTKRFVQSLPSNILPLRIVIYNNPRKDGGELSMVVHDPQQTPSPYFDGTVLSPGMITFIELKKIETHRLPHPYSSQCSNGSDTSTHLPGIYTYNGCFESCFMQKLNLFCGDIVPMQHYRYMPEKFKRNKTALNFTVEEQLKCFHEINDIDIFSDRMDCNCPQGCYEISFEKRIHLVKLTRKHFKELRILRLTEAELHDSLYTVIVHYNRLETEVIKEYPVYDLYSIAADIGGSVGLTLGASIISVVELVLLLVHKLFSCRKRNVRQG